MKTVDELKSYFETELAPDVRRVEAKRKRILFFRNVVFVLSLLAIAGCIYIKFRLSHLEWLNWGWIVFGVIFFGVVGFVLIREISANRGFYYDFKNLIIERIVQFIDPSFVYKSHKFIPAARLFESHLFSHTPTKKYRGDDYVVGKLSNGTKVEFSEVESFYKVNPESKETAILFKGLFFVAEVDRHFPDKTVIVPKNENLEQAGWYKNEKLSPVTLGSAVFDSEFNLHSNSQENNNHVLNDALLTDLIEFKRSTKSNIYASFIGNKVYVGISHEEDLFEPKLTHSLMDFSVIKEYYEVLFEAISIIERINPRG